MVEKSEEERISEIEKEFARGVEELFDRLKEVSRSNPELAGRLFSAVQGGYKRGRRKAYDALRVKGSYSLPPKYKLAFEACVQYAYSKGWISKPSPSKFASFAIRTVIQNLLRMMRQEDEEIARKAREESEEELRS